MKKWKLVAFALAMLIAVPAICLTLEALSGEGTSTVVFLEHRNSARGYLQSGNYTGNTLSGEDYVYDAQDSLLTCSEADSFDGSLKALVGTTRALMQDAGNGVTTSLQGVYSVPTTAGGLKIEAVLDDGTVIFKYNGTRIRLAPGERWETIYSDSLGTADYQLRLVRSDSIRNNGKIKLTS